MGCDLRGCNFSTPFVCLADFVCSGSFSLHVKFYRLVFMHQISTRKAGVNGKHPWYSLAKSLIFDIWFLDSNCERRSR